MADKLNVFSLKKSGSTSRPDDTYFRLKDYVAIARPDHWFKNVFMLPGAALAMVLTDNMSVGTWLNLLLGVAGTCLIASANYTINEWLDAEFDRHHPIKKHRPSACGHLKATYVYGQWVILATTGMVIATAISTNFAIFSAMLLAMGILYNVRPLRTKDRQYLDVLSESVNNPLRFMLGWSVIISDILPPSSILISYWMGGAYLMAIKRYAEYRFIDDPNRAGLYRRSFRFYTEETLLVSAMFYSLCAAFFLGVFLIKYRIEFLISMPFLALLFAWYLSIGIRSHSPAQNPERLYKEKGFIAYVLFVCILIGVLFAVDIPWLNVLVEFHVLKR